MFRQAHRLLLVTILGTLGLVGSSAAQTLPSAPVPVPTPSTGSGPVITRPGGIGVTPVIEVPGPSSPAPILQPPWNPPPVSPPPPPLGVPRSPTYGFQSEPQPFFNWELQFLVPTVGNHLQNNVTLPDGTTTRVAIPGNDLGFTVAPLFEFGYRFADNLGQLSLGYRFIVAEGKNSQAVDGENFDFRSRLNVNEFNLDYATAAYSPEPRWNLQGRIGIRLDSFFYDSQQKNSAQQLSASSYYLGTGPHASLLVERQLVLSNFAVFAKVDGAVLVGQERQKFANNVTDAFDASFQPQRKTLVVPTIQAQFGLSYTPAGMDWLKFRAGYQFEQWFNLGQGDSRLNLMMQGGFLGGEINF